MSDQWVHGDNCIAAPMTTEKATALRRPFPPESVGQLPKGGVMLDYVGHAAVTDRLLTVDPMWTWEPFALDAEGLPAPDAQGNLWIRLTVCGVTRIGVGDGKNAKERIGDAIRNAAMRFGVALDLWAKENLVEFAQAAQSHRTVTVVPDTSDGYVPDATPEPWSEAVAAANSQKADRPLDTGSRLAKAMYAALGDEFGHTKDDTPKWKAFMSEVVGREVTSSKELTEGEARRVLDHLPTKAGADA